MTHRGFRTDAPISEYTVSLTAVGRTPEIPRITIRGPAYRPGPYGQPAVCTPAGKGTPGPVPAGRIHVTETREPLQGLFTQVRKSSRGPVPCRFLQQNPRGIVATTLIPSPRKKPGPSVQASIRTTQDTVSRRTGAGTTSVSPARCLRVRLIQSETKSSVGIVSNKSLT